MKTLRTVLLTALGSVGAAVLLAGCGRHAPAMTYAQRLARARAAGLPVTMAQVQAPLPPPAQNAAPLYAALAQRLRDQPLAPEDELAGPGSVGALPSAQDLADARAALEQRPELLRLVHGAAARPQCVFVRDWTAPDPTQITFPELPALRAGARLLSAESLLLASRGQWARAVDNEALGFRMARHADSDHTLIGYLTGVAVDAITLSGLRKILYLSHGDPGTARAVRRAVAAGWRPLSLAASLRMESAFQQGVITMLRRTGPGGLDALTQSPPGSASGLARLSPAQWQAFLDANGAYLLGVMPQAVAAADRPYPQALPALQAVTADVLQPQDLTHLVAVIMFPTAAKAAEKRAQSAAQAAVTEAGAALLAYRAAHGSFPAALGQALSPVPADPFDGRPLRYKHAGPDFVVYSVGPDGFDGGTPFDRPDPTESLFRYPCPAYMQPSGD